MNDFPGRLRALMAERDLSTYALGRKVPCDPSLISRYRSGQQKPSERVAARLDEILAAGGELARLADRALPARRAVLAGGLLAGGMATVGSDVLGRVSWAESHQPRVDASVVDSLASVLAVQRRAEDALGAAAMLRPVLAQLSVIEDLVRQARGAVRPALIDVAQQWAQFAGWLCWDTGELPGARACYAQALEWAAELNDASMMATVFVQRGYMASDAGSIIGLASAAQRDGTAAPGQLAYAAQLEARGHAMAGDADATERRLARAEELAALTADPAVNRPWSYWMTPGFFRSEEGMTCAYLAGAAPRWHRRAVDLLGARLSEEVSLRTTASGLSCLALAHARAGLVDEACTSAEQAAGAARQSGSARVMDRLHRVHADLATRYPGHARVSDLAEALR